MMQSHPDSYISLPNLSALSLQTLKHTPFSPLPEGQRSKDLIMFPPWSPFIAHHPHLLQQSDSTSSLSQHHYPWTGTHDVHCTTPGPLLTQATHELYPSDPPQLYPTSLSPKHFISFSLILFLPSLLLLPLSSN